ncbi:MAG: hypothetical protein K5927_01935 [Lachnospiraceae bacterium]|nr:hypothetical protein [Lachnospiraceae bacterium]
MKKIFKHISPKVLIGLGIVVAAAITVIVVLKSKNAQLENELKLERLEADMFLPLFVEPTSDEQVAEASSEDLNTNGQDETAEVSEGTEDETVSDAESEEVESDKTSETEDETDIASETDDESRENTADSEDDTTVDDESESIIDISESDPADKDTSADPGRTDPVPTQPTTVVPDPVAPTPAPTTVAPTPAPTTVAPTTVALTTVAPTTVPPTTAAPQPVKVDPKPIPAAESTQFITAQQLQIFKDRLLQNINSIRGNKLSSNACLNSCSIVRSQEITTLWSHTRPNGDRGVFILAECGGWYAESVNLLKTTGTTNVAMGENLAYVSSYSDFSGTTEELYELADEMFENWKASDSHYQNMIQTLYNQIGIGVTVTMQDGCHIFWCCTLFTG